MPLKGLRVRAAAAYADGRPVVFRQDDEGVMLRIGERPEGPDQIIVLTVKE